MMSIEDQDTPTNCFSLDIGGTTITAGKVSISRGIDQKKSYKMDEFPNPKSWLEQLFRDFDTLDETPWVLGVPSPVENQDRLTETPNLPESWSEGSLTELLKDRSIDFQVENDANLAALGEFHFGNYDDVKNMVLLTLGTGIGMGTIIDGHLYRGSTGAAGEVGHVTVQPEGRPCNCGANGCLERYGSATGLEITYENLTGEKLTAKQITKRHETDSQAKEAIESTARWIGRGIAIVVNILEPETVTVTGGLSRSFSLFEPVVRNQYVKDVFVSRAESIPITTAETNYPALLGGAVLRGDNI